MKMKFIKVSSSFNPSKLFSLVFHLRRLSEIPRVVLPHSLLLFLGKGSQVLFAIRGEMLHLSEQCRISSKH
jgi:hypothetical protein